MLPPPLASAAAARRLLPLFAVAIPSTHRFLSPFPHTTIAGISRDSLHKRRATGGGPKKFRKKRK